MTITNYLLLSVSNSPSQLLLRTNRVLLHWIHTELDSSSAHPISQNCSYRVYHKDPGRSMSGPPRRVIAYNLLTRDAEMLCCGPEVSMSRSLDAKLPRTVPYFQNKMQLHFSSLRLRLLYSNVYNQYVSPSTLQWSLSSQSRYRACPRWFGVSLIWGTLPRGISSLAYKLIITEIALLRTYIYLLYTQLFN